MNWFDFNDAEPANQGVKQPQWARQPDLSRDEIKARLVGDLEGVLGSLYPQGFADPKGNLFYIGDVHGSAGESMSVQLRGERAGLWYDFATGEGGDILDLWQHARGTTDFASTLKDAAEYTGVMRDVPRQHPRRRPSSKTSQGIPVATYKYRDANGNLIAEVERFETVIDGKTKKDFRPWDVRTRSFRAPDPRPLYNLENLVSAPEIILVEGEKAADALIGSNISATTAMGGSNAPIEKTDWEPLRGRMVAIWPDNDGPGQKYAKAISEALSGVAAKVIILKVPEGKPDKWDAADAVEAGEDPRVLINEMRAEADTGADILPLEEWGDIQDVPVQWLVKDIIPQQSMVGLYGAPGSYKSFVAFYLSAMIGMGREAFGKQTEIGRVVYVMAEGGAGAFKRRRALEITHQFEQAPQVTFLRSALDLRGNSNDADRLIASIEARGLSPNLIVIDTLARNFAGGNENSSEDMGAFIRCIGHLMQSLQCAVLIVHHSGKDTAAGMRGHSALLGAVDTTLEVQKISEEDDDQRFGQITLEKQKDGEDGLRFSYEMRLVQTGLNASSLALVPTEIAPLRRPKLSGKTLEIYNGIRAYFDAGHGQMMTVKTRNGRGTLAEKCVVPAEDVRTYVIEQILSDRDKWDTRKKAYNRAVPDLEKLGFIGSYNKWTWINDV